MVKETREEDAQEQIYTDAESGENASTASGSDAESDELEKIKDEAAENYDKYLRACAEFENYKKRSARDREEFIKYGNERLIKDLLPIADSMERAMNHASDYEDSGAFLEGMKLIYEQFFASLAKHGVERIESVGETFDPNFHEAVLQVESKEHKDNKVVEEFEKGYLLNGRLLRPAKVSIAKHITKNKKSN
jgi:molecular chaperone GrpE